MLVKLRGMKLDSTNIINESNLSSVSLFWRRGTFDLPVFGLRRSPLSCQGRAVGAALRPRKVDKPIRTRTTHTMRRCYRTRPPLRFKLLQK